MSTNLSSTTAKLRVRRYLDEQEIAGSAGMYGESDDNSSLDSLIEKLLPEAINAVNLAAPSWALEKMAELKNTQSQITRTKGVMHLKPLVKLQAPMLRLVSFKTGETGSRLVTELTAEDSVQGRMQLDEYVRGQYDDPVLVLNQASDPYQPEMDYYSLHPDTVKNNTTVTFTLGYVPKVEEEPNGGYSVSTRLVDNIIYYLMARVLTVYNRTEEAKNYFDLASNF